MSRLAKLKKWFSIYDAATYIGATLKEPVDAADVLRLALDGHLVLSIHMVNGAFGRLCSQVEMKDIQWREVTTPDGKGILRLPVGGRVWEWDGAIYQVNRRVDWLGDGIWDLPLIGGERIDVEHKFQQIQFGPEPTAVTLDGIYVQDLDGRLFEVVCEYENRPKADSLKTFLDPENFHSAGALPEDIEFVVRADAINHFLRLQDEAVTKPEKALLSRERETLLNIIGVMLELLKNPRPGRDSDAALIKEMVENYGDKPGIKVRTLEEKFPASKKSLMSQ